jgi:hypothetical protein
VLLPLLCPAGQQNHQRLTVASEVNPVAWSPIDAVFEYAFTDAFDVGKVAGFQSRKRDRNLCACGRIEAGEPFFERASPVARQLVPQFKHGRR